MASTAAFEEAKARSGGEGGRGESWRAAAANCCMLAAGAGGGALLAWWALSFHQSNQQLWMVPVGLVLLGTPVFAWLSLLDSAVSRPFRQPPPSKPTSPSHVAPPSDLLC